MGRGVGYRRRKWSRPLRRVHLGASGMIQLKEVIGDRLSFLRSCGVGRATAGLYLSIWGSFERARMTAGDFLSLQTNPNTARTYYFALRRYAELYGFPDLDSIKPPRQKKLVPRSLLKEELSRLFNSPF